MVRISRCLAKLLDGPPKKFRLFHLAQVLQAHHGQISRVVSLYCTQPCCLRPKVHHFSTSCVSKRTPSVPTVSRNAPLQYQLRPEKHHFSTSCVSKCTISVPAVSRNAPSQYQLCLEMHRLSTSCAPKCTRRMVPGIA
eukprot:2698476-Rhodomonas_salina.1